MTQTEKQALYQNLENAGTELKDLQTRLQSEMDRISADDDPRMMAAFKLVTRSVLEASMTATSLSKLQTATA
jgi:hypothetical protein